jgi:hypothetical protein
MLRNDMTMSFVDEFLENEQLWFANSPHVDEYLTQKYGHLLDTTDERDHFSSVVLYDQLRSF